MAGRFRELLKKYGKVAMGVHFSVSAASISGLYVAIKSNVDVESILEKLHMGGVSSSTQDQTPTVLQSQNPPHTDGSCGIEEKPMSDDQSAIVVQPQKRNRTAELASSTGGALALAVLCNKALFPIRVPITIALTPPIARFLARRKIVKSGV